ncbi:proline dehydrogenase [bacterium]|nr:proline dehydrogenase [bacterium]
MKNTLYSQFCGGGTLLECEKTIESLSSFGVSVCLDYAVEGEHSPSGYERTCEELLHMISFSEGKDEIPFVVFKPTGIASAQILELVSSGNSLSDGQKLEWEKVRERVHRICEASYRAKKRLFIDAEESWMQTAIDDLTEEMMVEFNQEGPCVHHTLQFYRHDRLTYLKEMHERARVGDYFIGLKPVRGAYMEKERERALEMGYEDPIQPDKESTDRDYNECLSLCVENLDRVSLCAATHNEESTLLLVRKMEELKVERNHPNIFFSQLYGMGDHLTFNLSKSGFNSCKYLPYGPVGSVMPYLVRRAEENTAMGDQMSRDLRLLRQEIKRRGLG